MRLLFEVRFFKRFLIVKLIILARAKWGSQSQWHSYLRVVVFILSLKHGTSLASS